MTLTQYRSDPCRMLSIPYWKSKKSRLPAGWKIVHESAFSEDQRTAYRDEPYFRLYHTLQNIDRRIPSDVIVRTVEKEDLLQVVDMINRSYTDLTVTQGQLEAAAQTEVYDRSLWILAAEKSSGTPLACGIADLDREVREGSLEWIQVLPGYRRRKLGQLVVNQLLLRLEGRAGFATVSGKVHSESKPEALYRACGFVGNDIWHILSPK